MDSAALYTRWGEHRDNLHNDCDRLGKRPRGYELRIIIPKHTMV